MADTSKIEWTDATWNPTTGCTKISPGCAHCYIERTPPFRMAGRRFVKGHIPLVLHPERLAVPLKWRKPRRVFVNSLSDLFHADVPFEFIDQVFGVMTSAGQHVFQVLTKRPERMAEYMLSVQASGPTVHWGVFDELVGWSGDTPFPLPNVWLGTSVENQRAADERIPHLLRCPAAVRFLSAEPLLGRLDLGLSSATCDCCERWPSRWVRLDRTVRGDWPIGHNSYAEPGVYRADSNQHGALSVRDQNNGLLGIKPAEFTPLGPLDWVIVGCESNGRRVGRLGEFRDEADWLDGAADIVRQCRDAGVSTFVKQIPVNGRVEHDISRFPRELQVREFPREQQEV